MLADLHPTIVAIIQAPLHVLRNAPLRRQILPQERNEIAIQELRGLKGDDTKTQEQPNAFGPFGLRIIRGLANALDEDFVPQLFPFQREADGALDNGELAFWV